MNASVEFDVETLSPTYKLEIGTPGKSNAFEISKRLGLSEHILKRAKDLIGEDTKNINKILEQIEDDKYRMEAKNKEIEGYRREIQSIKDKLRNKSLEIEREKEDIIKKAEDAANKILEKANEESQAMLKEAKRSKNANTRDIDRSLNKIRNKFKDSYIEREEESFRK